MADIALKGNLIHTCGSIPKPGTRVPDFKLTRSDLVDVGLEDYPGLRKVLNIFPSVDTPVCALSVRAFNERAAAIEDVVVLNISADLPFAHKRFCAVEGIEGVVSLSCFRSTFPTDYGLRIVDGPLKGLCSRVVLVLDATNRVLHAEQVPEIVQEPDYNAALASLRA
jgi:thiol peroxidase